MATTTGVQMNGLQLAESTAEVVLSPSTAGILHTPQVAPDSARAASRMLQENHIKNHVFFNERRFINHIAHHLLTIFALGATPAQISDGYVNNLSYQRPQLPVDTVAVKQMASSRNQLASFYGQEESYHAYQEFFASEIEKKGSKAVLDEWLFKGDKVADGMLTRMFAGLLHPIIHLGFALEFHQPTILAESLAQAAVHKDQMGRYLLACEKAATTLSHTNLTEPSPSPVSLISLLHAVRSDATAISNSPPQSVNDDDDDDKLNTILSAHASRWTVLPTPHDLRLKTAELIQAATYFTAAAQHPGKVPKFDFFHLHCLNATVFFSAFVDDPVNAAVFGLDVDPDDDDDTVEDKLRRRQNLARLLEMKARAALSLYVSLGHYPDLSSAGVARIHGYTPRHPGTGWAELFARACAIAGDDDGHVAKLVRALANGERACREFEERENWPIEGEMWLKVGHMVMDSVEGTESGGPRWVRGAGR